MGKIYSAGKCVNWEPGLTYIFIIANIRYCTCYPQGCVLAAPVETSES